MHWHSATWVILSTLTLSAWNQRKTWTHKKSVNLHSACPLFRSWETSANKQTDDVHADGIIDCTRKVCLRLHEPLHTTGKQYIPTRGISSALSLDCRFWISQVQRNQIQSVVRRRISTILPTPSLPRRTRPAWNLRQRYEIIFIYLLYIYKKTQGPVFFRHQSFCGSCVRLSIYSLGCMPNSFLKQVAKYFGSRKPTL